VGHEESGVGEGGTSRSEEERCQEDGGKKGTRKGGEEGGPGCR
jgi:hypothetical protein